MDQKLISNLDSNQNINEIQFMKKTTSITQNGKII